MRLRFIKRLESLACCIRRRLFIILHRPNTAERFLATNVGIEPAEDVRTNPTQTRDATAIVSRETQSPLPFCHPEHKFIQRFPEILEPLTVPEHDSLKDSTFTFFSSFPPELRLQVWQYATSFSRVVEIQYTDPSLGLRYSASPRAPALLHTCQESRYEALKVYKACFGTKRVPKSIYINPARDVLFFRVAGPSQTWRYILGPNRSWQEQLRDVRRIALAHAGQYSGLVNMQFMKKTVCSFPNLEELVILWAQDMRERPLEGRGVNVIEQGPGHIDIEKYGSWRKAVRWKERIVDTWVREQWWRELGREPPIISVRHWCTRSESEW
jgi:hypothetical protein